MKQTPLILKKNPRSQDGMALIIVLALLVLITAMVVGFLVISGLEMNSSVFYKASSNDRLLADTVVNLEQSQINEATSQGPAYAWASQPGAIWTWNSNSSGTQLNKIYKLYSAQALTTTNATTMNTSGTLAGANDMPPTTWASDPALWVDLNASETDASGVTHYPILNPTQIGLTSSGTSNLDGFSINTSSAPSGTTTNDVPMPVQWLYVLQNGQIIPPDTTSSGTVVTFNNATVQPNSTNPIVGRIAYWTDDETCKVNINTAGGDGVLTGTNTTPIAAATFWDTPRYDAPDEVTLAQNQPQSGEYQRYPGHPGTIALNNILNGLGWNLGAAPSANFYSQTPRYAYGGSAAATVSIHTVAPIPLTSSPGNRLYPSVAEMLFNYQRDASVITSSNAPTSSNTKQQVETARFFLTAHSQAPEVTLFGQPRVSIWPEWTSNPTPNGVTNSHTRTPIDNVLAFCATVPGSTPSTYYFTRFDNTSDNVDIGLTESNGEQRNQMLLNYLDYFTSQPIPGYGNQFNTKAYFPGAGTSVASRQILTEIFDYIRTINLADTSQLASLSYISGSNSTTTNPWMYCAPWQNMIASNDLRVPGEFQVAPSIINSSNATLLGSWTTGTNSYQGFGIYPRLNEVAIHFVNLSQGALPQGAAAIPMNSYYTSGLPSNTSLIEQGDSGTVPGSLIWSTTTNEVTLTTNGYVAPGSSAATLNPSKGEYPTSTAAIQAFIYVDFTQPAQMLISNGVGGASGSGAGNGAVDPFMWVEISGLNQFKVSSNQTGTAYNTTGTAYLLNFPSDDIGMMYGNQAGSEVNGSIDEINFAMMLQNSFVYRVLEPGLIQGTQNSISGIEAANPFYSHIIPLAVNPTTGLGTMNFTGGPITISLYDGAGSSPLWTKPSSWIPSKTARLVQTYTINFGAANGGTTATSTTLPIPQLTSSNEIDYSNNTTATPPVSGPVMGELPTTTNSGDAAAANRWQLNINTKNYPNKLPLQGPTLVPTTTNDTMGGLIQPGDVVQSMVPAAAWSDPRMFAIANVPASAWTTHPNWGNITYPAFAWAYNLIAYDSIFYSAESATITTNGGPPFAYVPGVLNPTVSYYTPTGWVVNQNLPLVPPTLTASYINANSATFGANGYLMDWDNGIATLPDGPWINKVDEGQLPDNDITGFGANDLAYFYTANSIGLAIYSAGASFFSPNREVPSPGVLGSLSTGVDPTGNHPQGWQTLLFRPCPGHVGATSPPDHLWLDLFWMPVAEPYAISQPFSSEGKVNLNYAIQPFTYITRNTALRAVLNTQKIADMPTSQVATYKLNMAGSSTQNALNGSGTPLTSTNARYPLNVPVTLQQCQDIFDGTNVSGENPSSTPTVPDVFHSASEICDIYLVPLTDASNAPYSTASSFATTWYNGTSYGLVGDNVREKPYTNIYGLVTTKSNTYTVYYTVQSLKNAEPAANQNEWNESLGNIRGEYRGSTTLERYVDPNQSIPDFANSTTTTTNSLPTTTPLNTVWTLDGNVNATTPQLSYYKWRVVENHQFAP